MDLKETRILRLKAFIEMNGGSAQVARTFDIDASYLSQLINSHSSFGEKSARKLETKFNLAPYYLDRLEANQDLANYEVQTVSQLINKVPVLDMVQAGAFREAFEDLERSEYIATDARVREHTYALRVVGDSMLPIFTPGMIIIVEPDMPSVSGDYVIAKNGDNEATLKQLIKDGADWYLKPLNPQYPIKSANNVNIVGVVIQAQQVTKFK